MNESIIAFLRSQKVLTLALCDTQPYAATCFYAFEEEDTRLVFASDPKTKHIQIALSNSKVAGTIFDPNVMVEKIRGVQFQGVVRKADGAATKCYFARFPFAMAMRPVLWVVELEWVKMTDNTLGFGTKIIWTRRSK